MKKIAFMFAVAAMAVACGNEVALTADDSAAVIKALDDSIAAEKAAIKAPVAPAALADDADDAAKAAFEQATKDFQAAQEKYNKDTAAVSATRETRLANNLAAALAAKQAGDEKKDSTENK